MLVVARLPKRRLVGESSTPHQIGDRDAVRGDRAPLRQQGLNRRATCRDGYDAMARPSSTTWPADGVSNRLSTRSRYFAARVRADDGRDQHRGADEGHPAGLQLVRTHHHPGPAHVGIEQQRRPDQQAEPDDPVLVGAADPAGHVRHHRDLIEPQAGPTAAVAAPHSRVTATITRMRVRRASAPRAVARSSPNATAFNPRGRRERQTQAEQHENR